MADTTTAAPPQLTAADIKPGRIYSAKRAAGSGFPPLLNDRQVNWVDSMRTTVQYDSPTVAFGRSYPKVSMEAFLKWAKADVTDQMPAGKWRSA